MGEGRGGGGQNSPLFEHKTPVNSFKENPWEAVSGGTSEIPKHRLPSASADCNFFGINYDVHVHCRCRLYLFWKSCRYQWYMHDSIYLGIIWGFSVLLQVN